MTFMLMTFILTLSGETWVKDDVEKSIIDRYTERCSSFCKNNEQKYCLLTLEKILREDGGYHYNAICKGKNHEQD